MRIHSIKEECLPNLTSPFQTTLWVSYLTTFKDWEFVSNAYMGLFESLTI